MMASITDPLPGGPGPALALTDTNGAIPTSYTYEPFGSTTVAGTPSANPFQYTGRENDATGLYCYRARYYHPTLQRFTSEDPIGFDGGINVYAYVESNPLLYADPLGLSPSMGSGPISSSLGTCLGACLADHYLLTAFATASGAAAIPIPKARLVRAGGSSSTTNIISKLRRFGDIKTPLFRRIPVLTRQSVRRTASLLGFLGRMNPHIAAGLWTWDAFAVGSCTSECMKKGCQ